jgi:CubicO group peptidase (beta-lactamase class C family)
LTPDTEYFYRLKAQNGSTLSEASTVMTIKTATKQGDIPSRFAALETFITTEMAANKVNGLAGFIIKNNQVIWKKGFGKANVAENKNVDTETVFMIASVSKTVTSVVLMTLFDQGKFKLDDDINKYLPFKVVNPNFPDTPITIRMLMTHTSSIQDVSYNAIGDNITYRTGIDHPQSLATFMKDCLSPDGKYYNASTLFTDKKPGTTTKYSNVGSALCGYLAEVISGQNFHDYSKKVLSPLGFKNSAWAMKDVNLSNSAIPYEDDNSVIGHYSFVDYPNGGFRTNVEDFSKYMLMLMNGGTWNGVKILEKSTVTEMYKAQALGSGGYGLKFVVSNGGDEIGHSGGEKGVTAEMYFYPQTGIGVFVTFNKDNGALSSKIYKRMVEEAAK